MALLEGTPLSPEWLASVKAAMEREFGGAHFINLDVRRNGKNEHFEGDWVRTALADLIEDAERRAMEV